jgi:hypothetical protein
MQARHVSTEVNPHFVPDFPSSTHVKMAAPAAAVGTEADVFQAGEVGRKEMLTQPDGR